MNIAELLRIEMERRERWRQVILAKFEITGDPHHRLRRTEVLRELAHALGSVANNYFARKVIDQVVALGAVAIKPHNKRFYRGIRRRPACPSP